jgi:hypothetical protein
LFANEVAELTDGVAHWAGGHASQWYADDFGKGWIDLLGVLGRSEEIAHRADGASET